eukprot:scaffold28278_cov26-Tisochrysis_lutea.AAC.6
MGLRRAPSCCRVYHAPGSACATRAQQSPAGASERAGRVRPLHACTLGHKCRPLRCAQNMESP